MEAMDFLEEDEQPRSGGFVGLILGLAVGAVVLEVAAGPPHLPAHVPSWQVVSSTLGGSSLPLDVLAYLLSMAAWAVWFWIVASILFRLVLVGADAVARGAVWVHLLHRVCDRVTLPVVRRLVDGALLTMFVVNVVGRAAPGAAAASPPPVATLHVATVRPHGHAPEPTPAQQRRERPRDVEYTVQPGDTLWGVAERFYGTGYEFPRLVTANVGRQMPDGEHFTRAGVIQPGWVLRIPPPNLAVEEVGGRAYYVVEEGDSLRGIAARLLGSEGRWRELFDLNRGNAGVDGRILEDPDLIWPGLHLQLPPSSSSISNRHPAGGGQRPTSPRQPPRRSLSSPPVRPTPSPVLPTPTPGPTEAVSTPITARTPTESREPQHGTGDDATAVDVIVGASAAAVAGGAVLLARRRVRRHLSEPPVPIPKPRPPIEEFAEAEPDRILRHRLQGDETELVVLVAEQVRRFLNQRGMERVPLVMARHGHNTVTLLLRIGPQEAEFLRDSTDALGARLGGRCVVSSTPDGDIALQVSGLKQAALIVSPAHQSSELQLVPIGLLPTSETLYVNWSEVGHVLVTGQTGGGADVILTSLLATLAARRRPDDLRLWTIASHLTLPSQLAWLPHQSSGFVDPAQQARVQEALASVRAELLRRMRATEEDAERCRSSSAQDPEIVLVVGELGDLEDDGTTLEMIGAHGSAHGIRLLAASTQTDALDDPLLGHFTTRVVLQTLDDDESIRLLGQRDGKDLGAGEFLLRIDRRSPIRLRGLRISPEHLDELIRLMQDAYGAVATAEGSSNVGVDRDEAGSAAAMSEETDVRHEGLGETDTASPPVFGDDVTPGLIERRSETEGVEAEEEDLPPTDHNPTSGVVPALDAPGGDLDEMWSTDVPVQLDQEHNGHRSPALFLLHPPGVTPIVQVRCFGELTVRSGERQITPYREGSPSFKAWELLAFLASQPGGAIARGKLLAALWPDLGEARAANCMHVTMSRLRDVLSEQIPGLPAQVVRNDRKGICRLDTTLVTSDVEHFLALLQASRKLPREQAKWALWHMRGLYVGDLLSGPNTPLYEWVDERDASGLSLREQYREDYYRATQRLAQLYVEEGHANMAIPLYKEILRAEPVLEDIVRELYRCYQQTGDLIALIREDRHLRHALQEAFADPDNPAGDVEVCQPEPGTIALFEEIRRELEARNANSTG